MRRVAFLLTGTGALVAGLTPALPQNLSTYGTPGLIDMPTAQDLPDGNLAGTATLFRNSNRNTVTFQLLPRVYGSFRYSYLGDFKPGGVGRLYDRSFDVQFMLQEETETRPAVAIGLRDITGTGVYSGEYLVATKTFADRLSLTGGIGWGRLAGRGGFTNPLAIFGTRFRIRPSGINNPGGQFNTGKWFRGDAALFGGVEYRYSDRLSFLAEYSSDVYSRETANFGFKVNSPINLGVSYRFRNGAALSGYYLYGSTFGVQLSYSFDPRKPAAPGGQGRAAPALLPVDRVALASWNLPDRPADAPSARDVLRVRLDEQGLLLTGYEVRGNRATIEIENRRYQANAQAVGRAARAMANTLDPSVSEFVVILQKQGVPITSVTIRRSDLYEFENHVDGAWRSYSRARVDDGLPGLRGGTLDGVYPRFGYRFGPFVQLSFFDPDNPLRYEVGADLQGDYTIRPGLALSGLLRLPVFGNLADTTRVSDSVLPHVRSDWPRYAKESDLRINHLTAEYIWRPSSNTFARVTAGYLEEMYGGVSAEMLWYPVGSRLALGGEINYARQRNFDMKFGFRDYDVVMGHASLYYEFPGDFRARIDAGRYLAGDWGATFSLDREFNNGFKIGAFFTLTDVSATDFGEGSFDKGIRFEVPLSWFTRKPSRTRLKQTIRPILRDGGAQLNVRNRLYEYTREERANGLQAKWGRFFR